MNTVDNIWTERVGRAIAIEFGAICPGMGYVVTARQAKDGSSRTQMRTEQHDVLPLMLHDGRIVDRFHWIRNVGFGEDRILTVPPDDTIRSPPGFMLVPDSTPPDLTNSKPPSLI